MEHAPVHRCEVALAALLLIWVLLLHGCFFFSAGALWRDEANSVLQSQLGGWGEIWNSLQFDSFPILYPLTLKAWVFCSHDSGDRSYRVAGLLTGLLLVVSVWWIPRILGGRIPIVALLLLAANPLLVTEGDSIRPYGIGLSFLLWAFAGLGKYLMGGSSRWLLLAGAASILSVQSSYTNALFIGVVSVSAVWIALRHRRARKAASLLLPGMAAAISLLPYSATLRAAGRWAAMVHYRVDWKMFLGGIVDAYSPFVPLVWLGFLFWALMAGIQRRRQARPSGSPSADVAAYATIAALLGVVAQVVFIEAMKVPPSPRYFLSSMALVVFAVELGLRRAGSLKRASMVLAAVLLTAVPSWTWLRLRRSNADQIASELNRQAAKDDLVILSPWFLHPSFQRYYRSSAAWATVPPLPHHPMTRYDLIQAAMSLRDSMGLLEANIQETLDRRGTVWFVSQMGAKDLAQRSPPQAPPAPLEPDGTDYVRFRSYWERDAGYLLNACCMRENVPLPDVGRIWNEEHLVLSRWSTKRPAGQTVGDHSAF